MKLSIIILNYRSRGLLKQCLRGIVNDPVKHDHEIIVVDNNSGDDSLAMVTELFPAVKVIQSSVNRGFAAGNNLGIELAQGDYILIVNPDVAVFSQAIDRMITFLDKNPKVGIVVPKLTNPDGSTQLSAFLFPSMMIPFFRRTPLGRLPIGQRLLRKYVYSDWDHNSSRPIGWGLGACMMIRQAATRDCGVFDERFFLYYEDVDLCRRFWDKGWEVHYLSESEMVHYHQRLSAEYPGLKGIFSLATRIHIQSAVKYFAKYLGVPKPKHSL